MKSEAKKAIIRFLTVYGIYGLITICQPRLVSDEVAEKSEIMGYVQAFGDGFVEGATRYFTAPIRAAKWVKDRIMERVEEL